MEADPVIVTALVNSTATVTVSPLVKVGSLSPPVFMTMFFTSGATASTKIVVVFVMVLGSGILPAASNIDPPLRSKVVISTLTKVAFAVSSPCLIV